MRLFLTINYGIFYSNWVQWDCMTIYVGSPYPDPLEINDACRLANGRNPSTSWNETPLLTDAFVFPDSKVALYHYRALSQVNDEAPAMILKYEQTQVDLISWKSTHTSSWWSIYSYNVTYICHQRAYMFPCLPISACLSSQFRSANKPPRLHQYLATISLCACPLGFHIARCTCCFFASKSDSGFVAISLSLSFSRYCFLLHLTCSMQVPVYI